MLYLAGLACSMEEDMAKGQLRSNREKKKPKADKNKSKTSKPASPVGFSTVSAKGAEGARAFALRSHSAMSNADMRL